MARRQTILRILALMALVNASSGQLTGVQRSLVCIGGALSEDNSEVYGRFIELSGGRGVAVIGVITAASSDPEGNAEYYTAMLRQYGAAEVYWIDVHLGNLDAAYDPEIIAKLLTTTGVFFGGGDQMKILDSLFIHDDDVGDRLETPLMAALREVYETGTAAFAGTSAGNTVMTSTVMVQTGHSYAGILNGAQPDVETPQEWELTYDPEGGLGFVPGILVDSHFSERGREARIMRLLADTLDEPLGTTRAFGVDEDTALVVTSELDGSIPYGEVVGVSGVYFIDIGQADVSQVNGIWAVENVETHYLTSGDIIDLTTWTDIAYAPYKSDLKGQELNDQALTSNAIFSGNHLDESAKPQLTQVATSLVDSLSSSTTGDSLRQEPTLRMTLTKTEFTLGFGGNPDTPDDPDRGPGFQISYQGLVVSINALD